MLKEKIQNLVLYTKLKALYKKYERLLMPATLLLGFLTDVITFRTINIFWAFVLLTVHISLVTLSIFLINFYDAHWLGKAGKPLSFLRLAAPIVMQFSFGNLLSASFIFYSFGGVFSVSWPLILLLLFLMVANEVFKESYLKPTVQISALFFCLITLLSLVLPYSLRSISPWVFVLVDVVSVFLIYFFICLLSRKVKEIKEKQKNLGIYIALLFILMNGLYFLNIIPPVPLALRDGGVYHDIVHVGQSYRVTAEKESIWQKIIPGKTVSVADKTPVYVFTAIFSPADLNTEIVHDWQKYDEASHKWISMKKLSFKIVGGRKDGYRGYSISSNVAPGKWRVYVETKRGQVLGKVSFKVKQVETLPEMETLLK